ERERLAGVLMPPEPAIFARYPVLRRLLLPAGGVLAFLLFLVVTFPYDVLARRIEIEAQRAGAELTLGSVGAGGLASVRARDVRALSLDDGTVTGGAVMGFAIPRTAVGRLDGSISVEKGIARVEKTAARGGDVEADMDGNVNLRPLLSLSQADLHLRFRPA